MTWKSVSERGGSGPGIARPGATRGVRQGIHRGGRRCPPKLGPTPWLAGPDETAERADQLRRGAPGRWSTSAPPPPRALPSLSAPTSRVLTRSCCPASPTTVLSAKRSSTAFPPSGPRPVGVDPPADMPLVVEQHHGTAAQSAGTRAGRHLGRPNLGAGHVPLHAARAEPQPHQRAEPERHQADPDVLDRGGRQLSAGRAPAAVQRSRHTRQAGSEAPCHHGAATLSGARRPDAGQGEALAIAAAWPGSPPPLLPEAVTQRQRSSTPLHTRRYCT